MRSIVGWEGEHLIPRKRNKHGVHIDKLGKAERTADGFVFDSKAECGRYHELLLLQRAKRIRCLAVHPAYPIIWPGTDAKICVVELDFRYEESPGVDLDSRYPQPWRTVVEDFKGQDTALSKIKRKLVESAYGIKIELVRAKR